MPDVSESLPSGHHVQGGVALTGPTPPTQSYMTVAFYLRE